MHFGEVIRDFVSGKKIGRTSQPNITFEADYGESRPIFWRYDAVEDTLDDHDMTSDEVAALDWEVRP